LDIKNRDCFRPLDSEDFERMNVGRNFWDSSLTDIDDSLKYKAELVDYIDGIGENLSLGKGFMFWGEGGTGKTSAAVILAKAAVSFNHTYVNLINRSFMITTTAAVDTMWGDNYYAREELEEMVSYSDLFILDDLGMEKEHESVGHAVENIVRMRLNSGRSLVITTNLGESRLDKRYGKLFKQLLLDGGCKPVELTYEWRLNNIRRDFPGGVDYA